MPDGDAGVRTLAIDTATPACSIALIERGMVIAHAHDVVGRGHAEYLLPMIAALPGGGRADRILVDVGPGSFTGVRVGIAAARALALGWNARAYGYSSLPLIAAAALAHEPLVDLAVLLEGGHGEVFMQNFAPSPFRALDALASLTPAAALAALGDRHATGSGTRRLAPLAPARDWPAALPDARDVLLLPTAFTDLPPRPIYGRAPDAKLPA